MTAATIIREAQSDGVRLFVSPDGTLKATGDGASVKRWQAAIREHKIAIIDVLKDETAIRAWLDRIGETDVEIIAEVIERCRQDADARRYFLMRAAEA